MRRCAAVLFSLLAAAALAQPRTTEQQARSYVLSAFMSGAAPAILADDVALAPELRERLGLAANAEPRRIYEALMQLTGGRSLRTRPATPDEINRLQRRPELGKPLVALEAGDTTLVMQYDLARDRVSFVADPKAAPPSVQAAPPPPPPPAPAPPPVAAPAPPPPPVAAPAPLPPPAPAPPPMPYAAPAPLPPPAPAPRPIPYAAPAPLPPPAPAPPPVPYAAPASPPPGPPPAPPPSGITAQPLPPLAVEPPKPVLGPAAAKPVAHPEVRTPGLQRTGPCVFRRTMTDQDLVNCGASSR